MYARDSEGSSYGQQTIQGAYILKPPSTTADGGLIKDRFDHGRGVFSPARWIQGNEASASREVEVSQ